MALSTLNDDGYLAFCESDFVVIPSGMLTAAIAGKPVFLNDPTYPHDGVITLAHCTAPRKLDGANVEILEAVGKENFFLFGLTVDQVQALIGRYDPRAIIEADADFASAIRLLESGHFNPGEPGILDVVIRSLQQPSDPWMTAADFRAFVDAHRSAEAAYADAGRWTQMSILNTAASGRFSTDRTIREYNEGIWRLEPIELNGR